MVDVLLLGCSFCLGLIARDLSLAAFDRLDKYRQASRLKTVMGPGRKAFPLRNVLTYLEGYFRGLGNVRSFHGYQAYLVSQCRRANRTDWGPSRVMGCQFAGGVTAGLVIGLLLGSPLFGCLGFLLGIGLPLLWLRDRVRQREGRLLRELPNALEVLSLCSEAGLTLEQGMEQYLKNSKAGPVREELTVILEQSRSGSDRKSALEAAASKLDLTDFSLFTASLIQAERFGTGIARTLRQLSMTMRDKQAQRVEKAVQEMPVKMLFPLVLCIMPVTFLVIFGPIVLQFLAP